MRELNLIIETYSQVVGITSITTSPNLTTKVLASLAVISDRPFSTLEENPVSLLSLRDGLDVMIGFQVEDCFILIQVWEACSNNQ
jgi:hypothetical protein